ncbi:MAG: hypothetical protein AB7N71_14245 [Phycisphaerae bacterium]
MLRAFLLRRAHRLIWYCIVTAGGLLTGCNANSSQRQEPVNANRAEEIVSHDPNRTMLPKDFLNWSRNVAAKKLYGGGEAQLFGALRLAQLADCEPLLAPDNVTDATVRLLRVKALDTERYLLGVAVPGNERAMRAPVMIHNDGRVETIAAGVDEELATLYISADADIFPHIVLTPHCVSVLHDATESAIVLASADSACRFRYQENRGAPYIALSPAQNTEEGDEAARFTWDPYELFFSGPASDYLDEKEGLTFEIDIAASPLLIPQGGIIPEAKTKEPEPEKPAGPRILDLNDRDTIPT